MAGIVDVRPDVARVPDSAGSRGTGRARRYAALVFVVGILVTCGFAYRVAKKPGVYWSEVNVLFLAPTSALNPNALVTSTGDLANVAGTVARLVDPNQPSARVVDPDVKLVNEGIRNGYAVTLPNDGGQWANNFDKSLLDVQVVGPTVAGVQATTQQLLAKINAALASLQDQANVAKVNRITTSLSPSEPQYYYARGSRSRALLTTVALGLGITIFLTVAVRRRLTSRGDE